jgi:hypothetical protein
MAGEVVSADPEVGDLIFDVGVVATFVVGVLCGDGSGEVNATGCSDVLATGEAMVAGVINTPPSPDTGWKNKKAVNTLPDAAIKNIVRFIIS